MELERLFEGISDRYKNLVLFMPIYQLSQGTKYKYDLMEIGFSLLLFMIDKMLTDKGYVTNTELTQFLLRLMKEVYEEELSYEEADELRTYLVDEKLRNNGKDFLYEYKELGSREKKSIEFSLIETYNFKLNDHLENKINLKLTEKGVELLFKTKEMFSEMQISITMLYFKQQLDKSLYGPALNTVRDLIFQIETQIRAIEDYEEKIRRNTLSVFNRKEIEDKYESSYKQTLEEKEQLKSLKEYVGNVKNNYLLGTLTKKQRQKFETILEIDHYLNRSMTKHEILFTKKYDLLRTLTGSIQLLIENAFSRNFHFEQEILQVWVEKLVTQEKIHKIFKPIIPLKRPRHYHPLLAFAPQATKTMSERFEQEIDELDEEAKEAQHNEKVRKEEIRTKLEIDMLKVILKPLLTKESYHISEVLKDLRVKDFSLYQVLEDDYLQHFLNMGIEIHRWKYKEFESEENMDNLAHHKEDARMLAILTNEIREFEEIQGFEMYSTEKEIEFANGIRMTDYLIRRKELTDAI